MSTLNKLQAVIEAQAELKSILMTLLLRLDCVDDRLDRLEAQLDSLIGPNFYEH